MEHVVKAMYKSGPGFLFFKNNFSRISEAKIKSHICRPTNKGAYAVPWLRRKFNGVENAAWKYFKNVAIDLFGNKKAKNYGKLDSKLRAKYSVTNRYYN